MIQGSMVTLRPAEEADRRAIYHWLAESDVTPAMMGPPHFPDAPPPTWEEFCEDYGPPFFDGTMPELERSYMIEVGGEPVGHVNYEVSGLVQRTAELDIWLRSEADTGQGYGPDALVALTRHIHETFGVDDFIIRPSQRNARAIQAYKKAGFKRLSLTKDQQAGLYGPGDYADTVVMRMRPCSTP
jgi:RimJ/RimL family protein N-acetyltransferase